jgi:hypothetical protein
MDFGIADLHEKGIRIRGNSVGIMTRRSLSWSVSQAHETVDKHPHTIYPDRGCKRAKQSSCLKCTKASCLQG